MKDEAAQERLKIVNSLMNLKQQFAAGAAPEVLRFRLDQILANLVPLDLDDLDDEVGPAAAVPLVR